jgi:4-diphosphocytidyl-2-C-methyl-D-erythritol kinase
MSRGPAFAKINLGLVVGPHRDDGKHEVVTVLQRVDLHDDIELELADELTIDGFDDTIVREALESLALTAEVEPRWSVRIEKRIPVAAGLAGGSSDAATALGLANDTLVTPLDAVTLHRLAAEIGADVPFFLHDGPRLATGDGSTLHVISLPVDYHVVLVVPHGAAKESTGAVYQAFDARNGATGFVDRVDMFRSKLAAVATARDLRDLPSNDLASSPISSLLIAAGAFRADVSGAGPTVYGLFEHVDEATEAAESLGSAGRTYLTRPLPAVDLS